MLSDKLSALTQSLSVDEGQAREWNGMAREWDGKGMGVQENE